MNTVSLVILGAVASIVAALFVYLLFKTSRLNATDQALRNNIAQLQQANGQLQHQLNTLESRLEETNAGVLALHGSMQGVPEQISSLEGQLRDQVQQDPQIKLYQKAASMAQEGASAEDIALACELPVAEASVLVSLHSGK